MADSVRRAWRQPVLGAFWLLTSIVLLAAVACGDSDGDSAPELDDPDQTATELVERYVDLVKDRDQAGLRDFLSDAFIIVRTDGSQRGKADYIADLPTIGDFQISEVNAIQDGDVLTVHWVIRINVVVGDVEFSDQPAPRLSTFAYRDGSWRLAAHANLNPVVGSTD